jgi:hypothetical protein
MYLDISLIFPKSNDTQNKLFNFLKNEYGLNKGENLTSAFKDRKIIVFLVDNEDVDYDEVCVDFSEQIFHKETFEREVDEFTNFVNHCFEYNPHLKYALCSYELNGYLLGGIKRLNDFNSDLLKCFLFVYERKYLFKPPLLQINKEAQDIFVQ